MNYAERGFCKQLACSPNLICSYIWNIAILSCFYPWNPFFQFLHVFTKHSKLTLNAQTNPHVFPRKCRSVFTSWGEEKRKKRQERREVLKAAYLHPHHHWTWWRHTSPTPCGCRPDSGHMPRGTWAAGWTVRWSTKAHTKPSSCRSGQTSD